MRTKFVPQDYKVPVKVNIGKDYYLVPITVGDLEEDLKTLLNNADAITEVRGGSGARDEWPYVCSKKEDYKDLEWLEVSAKHRKLFSYILRSNEDDSYVGCIYIYPIELYFAEKSKDYDVDFSFWITQSELDNGKYGEITKDLLTWLINDWPFNKERIFLRNKLVPKEANDLLK